MPFENLGVLSYSPSIVTLVVSVLAVCEIFSVKEWCDLENRVNLKNEFLYTTLFTFRQN